MKKSALLAFSLLLALLGGAVSSRASGGRPSPAAASGGAGAEPPSFAAPSLLAEFRGLATVTRTLERLGIPATFPDLKPEDAPFFDFDLARDTSRMEIQFPGNPHTVGYAAYSPADLSAYRALYASESWSNEPDTPEGFQVYAPPSRAYTNYHAVADGKFLGSESPDALRDALALLPSLPATLPAEGDLVVQFPGETLSRNANGTLGLGFSSVDGLTLASGSRKPEESGTILRNVASLTAGLGIDGDTAALQAVLAPVPGSQLAALLDGTGTIPPATACVNLPGTLAFAAAAKRPPIGSTDGPPASLPEAFANHLDAQPHSFAFFPPAAPGIPRALAFTGLDAPAAARDALLALPSRHPDVFSVASSTYHAIPVDTLSVVSPYPLAPIIARHLGIDDGRAGLLAYFLANPRLSYRFAWSPEGLVFAVGDPDASLLHAALDALRDGGLSTRQFESSPAFRAAFPHPDAPALALAHLDLAALRAAYDFPLPFDLPTPCPVDLFAYVADGSSLVLRLRAPVPLVRTLATATSGNADSSNPGGAGDPPAATPLSPTPFMGYPEAYVLSNAHLHAVVVPAISRLAFLAPSADSPNLLRFDSALAEAGATPPDPSTAPDFFNIGGDWVWPVLQTRWPSFTVDGHPYGRDWPPPPALADGPSDAEAWVDKEGNRRVRLARHYPSPVHATLVREFILAPDGNVLKCQQSLTRDPSPCVDETPLPIALWHVSQVANPDQITFPVPATDFAPTVMAGALDPDAYFVEPMDNHSPLASYTPPPSSEVKLSLPFANLMATTLNGHFLVLTSDPDAHAELYSNTGLGYAELETVTPDYSSIPNMWVIANTLTYIIRPAP